MSHDNSIPGDRFPPDLNRGTGAVTPRPWPLRIYTLGRFSVVRNDTPLRSARKSPGKPLLLLKALIASGGRQISAGSLCSILWPEQDGDRAQQAFETTLHRLRKFLQDDGFLLLEDGHLSLNNARVWVDIWDFERNLGVLRNALAHPDARDCPAIVDATGGHVMALYQGHFLMRDDPPSCWMISLQERLRNKFVHTLLQTGDYWERRGLPEKAIDCYRKGIEVDDLIETFYQHLITCYGRTGREPEAIAAYRQCRHLLSVVLGLQPTAETQARYQKILSHYHRRAG